MNLHSLVVWLLCEKELRTTPAIQANNKCSFEAENMQTCWGVFAFEHSFIACILKALLFSHSSESWGEVWLRIVLLIAAAAYFILICTYHL